MRVDINIGKFKLQVDMTAEEFITIAKAMEDEEVNKDGYGYEVEQYDGHIYDGLEEVHKGFKIYKSGIYYTWCSGKEYNTHSELHDTVEEARLDIDDHIERMIHDS